MDTDNLTRSRLEVFILRVVSPLLFWVRLKNSDRDLQEMEEELALRMSHRSKFLLIWPEDLEPDMDVVIKVGDSWQRGWIEKISRISNTVRVRLGDHAWSTWRPMHEIYRLEDRFRSLPWQAIVCGLAHSGSPTNMTTWPEKTRELCRLLAEDHTGWINILLPLGRGKALVKLTVQGENNVGAFNLRDILIKLGHVRLSPQEWPDVSPSL